MTHTTILRTAVMAAALAWAAPAFAQPIDPCPAPAKEPPANSPALVACMQIVAHPVNETLVDAQTYAFYIRSPRTVASRDQWAPYNESTIREDFWNLWRTNFLENLWVEVIDEPFANGVAGKHVIFHIEEKSRVKAVDYVPIGVGAKLQVDASKIDTTLRERNIEVRLDSFVDEATIRRVVGVIRELYAQEGYGDARIEPEMREVAGGQKLIDLRFNITEGPRVRIQNVQFEGNTAFEDGKLGRQMKENRGHSWLSITGGDTFKEDKFPDDAERVAEFYKNNGFAAAQVGAPQSETVETSEDGKTRWIRLRVPIDEGLRYRVGTFEVTNATALKSDALRQLFKIEEGEEFSLKKLRKGFEKVKEVYGTFGFYQWQPEPDLKPRGVDPTTGQPLGPEPVPPIMDINIRMNEGKQFFVNRITFSGNTSTHDAVIRRELRLFEGSVFDSEAMKSSVRRLNQLGYFKPLEGKEGEMEVTPTPGSDNKVDIQLKVEEQNRNQISFGAGVSQFEGFFGQLSFQTSNFLGRGETVGISLQKGSQAKQYQLSFSEPYLFDRPINVGVDLHSRQFIYPGQFTQENVGGNAVIGFPLADYTRTFLGYSYEVVRVLDVNPAYLTPEALVANPFLADSLLLSQGGRRKVGKISPSVIFNTVNQPIFPSAGTRYSLSFDFAGVGGNTFYTQTQGEAIWYVPLTTRMSLGLRAQGEYIRPYGATTTLPIIEKLFIGGEYSVRGFDIRSIAPRDPMSGVLTGGNKSLVFNAEYYVNLFNNQVRVLGFYDAGQVQEVGQKFSWTEPVVRLVTPDLPLLFDPYSTDQLLLTAPGAIHTQVIGKTSSFRTSTGGEVRFFLPVLNVPFRLIGAWNPQRFGVLNNNGVQTPKFTFRFAVGTTF